MKNIFLRTLLIFSIIFLILKGLEWLLETNFQKRINSNPDRAYNLTYEGFDLHTFFKGVTLNKLRIEPLNKTEGTLITGNVDYATLKGMVWVELLFGKRLSIREISFQEPVFEITLSADTVKKTSGKGIQAMFGDILSRVDLENFNIQNGSLVMIEPQAGNIKGQVRKINIKASEIETDSVQLKNIIPFNMGSLIVEIENASYDLNDYTQIGLGKLNYDLKQKKIVLNDISLGYSIDWVEVSKRIGVQTDVIELDIKTLAINQLQPSHGFYTDLDINSRSMHLDQLNIKLQRNKNFSRPPDEVKPMFKEMINAIPLRLELDSVQISNSSITYSELGEKKEESGNIIINNINGDITGITNVGELQQNLGKLNAELTSNLGGEALMKVNLTVPYDREAFNLDVQLAEMDLTKLNPTLQPLAGLEIESGQLNHVKFHMAASMKLSQNTLVFDYSDLRVNVVKESEDHILKKRVFLSSLANAAIRNNNMPDNEKYQTAQYETERNIYRSPINYIIQGLIQGIMRIVPGKTVQKALTKDKKKKKKN